MGLINLAPKYMMITKYVKIMDWELHSTRNMVKAFYIGIYWRGDSESCCYSVFSSGL